MCLEKTLNELLFERALREWRRSTARTLERAGRGGVPDAVATYHRRYNLFEWLFMGSAMVFVARLALLGRDQSWIDAVLFAVCALTVWPLQQINKTHRRRKWFD